MDDPPGLLLPGCVEGLLESTKNIFRYIVSTNGPEMIKEIPHLINVVRKVKKLDVGLVPMDPVVSMRNSKSVEQTNRDSPSVTRGLALTPACSASWMTRSN